MKAGCRSYLLPGYQRNLPAEAKTAHCFFDLVIEWLVASQDNL
jgi:hypothetical protein